MSTGRWTRLRPSLGCRGGAEGPTGQPALGRAPPPCLVGGWDPRGPGAGLLRTGSEWGQRTQRRTRIVMRQLENNDRPRVWFHNLFVWGG